MRWILVLIISAFVLFGCEEDKTDETYRIVVVEAPTRLPYVTNFFLPLPYETTAVSFVVRLEPSTITVDSVLCRVFDPLGSQIEAFKLFDDGGNVEYQERATCEDVFSGDTLEGDGFYTRAITPFEFTVNYSDAEFTFEFSTGSGDRVVMGATTTAQTWLPWITATDVSVAPTVFPLCGDSLVVLATIKCDSTDSLEFVAFGTAGNYNQLSHVLANCTAISGDTLWRAVAYRTSPGWGVWGDPLVLGARTAKGRSMSWGLEQFTTLLMPIVDLSIMPSEFRITAFGVPDTFPVTCQMDLCSTFVGEPIGSEFGGVNMSNDTLTIWGHQMNDCGLYLDSIAFDNIYTGMMIVTADTFTIPQPVSVIVLPGINDFPDACAFGYWALESESHSKVVYIFPPQ